MYFLDFDDHSKTKTASFRTIKNIHSLEEGQLIKYAYGISIKALCPTSMERQNVKLVLQIFNDHVVEGLRKMGEQTNEPFCSETAQYIEIINRWWKIMNVKSSYKGHHKRDTFLEPLTSNNSDERNNFLMKFLLWIDDWKAANYNSGFLTRETFTALSHTTHAVIELCDYCSSELGFSYLLTGKIQTDVIERRFGKFRQLSGGNYNISIRQVFESECKLRLQSIGPLKIQSAHYGEINIDFSETCNIDTTIEKKEHLHFLDKVNVEEDDLIPLVCVLPVLTYVAGYCCYSYAKSKKCQLCKETISLNDIDDVFDIVDNYENSYIQTLDRGGLAYPKPEILDIILHSFVVVQKLVSENHESLFLQVKNQKAIAVKIIINVLEKKEIYLCENKCKTHSASFIVESLVGRAVNTFLNNYCKENNNMNAKEKFITNQINSKKLATKKINEPKSKKRKLATLIN